MSSFRSAASRITPRARVASRRPASNCGLIKASRRAPDGKMRASAGNNFSMPMNEASTTASSSGSAKCVGSK